LPPGSRRLSTTLKYRCSLPFFRRLQAFKYMQAMIPPGGNRYVFLTPEKAAKEK
jgi:hypothetical protein